MTAAPFFYALESATPYAFYLPYALTLYVAIIAGLFSIPALRFIMFDWGYLRKKLEDFRSFQIANSSSSRAIKGLRRFGAECRELTGVT